jgi:hypothetical protein
VKDGEAYSAWRRLLIPAALVAAEVVVIAVAHKEPTDGAVSVVAALVLAPLAVLSVNRTAARLATGWFPVLAAFVYVLLPLVATRFFLPGYRPIFERHALPALVGLQETWAFALGVVIVLALSILPRGVAAAGAVVLLVVAIVVWGFGDLGVWQPSVHETGWSVALPEWLLVASVLGAMLRSPAIGGALGAVIVATVLRATHHQYYTGDFWSAFGVAAPTAAVLVSSVALLVPPPRRARVAPPAQAPSES